MCVCAGVCACICTLPSNGRRRRQFFRRPGNGLDPPKVGVCQYRMPSDRLYDDHQCFTSITMHRQHRVTCAAVDFPTGIDSHLGRCSGLPQSESPPLIYLLHCSRNIFPCLRAHVVGSSRPVRAGVSLYPNPGSVRWQFGLEVAFPLGAASSGVVRYESLLAQDQNLPCLEPAINVTISEGVISGLHLKPIFWKTLFLLSCWEQLSVSAYPARSCKCEQCVGQTPLTKFLFAAKAAP